MPIRDEDPDDGGEELRSGLGGGHEGGARHVYEGVASKVEFRQNLAKGEINKLERTFSANFALCKPK
jgi:hypothetical protein